MTVAAPVTSLTPGQEADYYTAQVVTAAGQDHIVARGQDLSQDITLDRGYGRCRAPRDLGWDSGQPVIHSIKYVLISGHADI